MEIKTKFHIGDKVFFFKDYNQEKPCVAKDIVGGTVIVIEPWISNEVASVYYYVAVNNGEVNVPETHLYGSYEEIEAKAVDRPEKVNDSVREAYERLGRELGLI